MTWEGRAGLQRSYEGAGSCMWSIGNLGSSDGVLVREVLT